MGLEFLKRMRLGPRRAEITVDIPAASVTLKADLFVPGRARGLVLFAHGSGSTRRSPRNRSVAEHFWGNRLGTLLLDLQTPAEDADSSSRFDPGFMVPRLEAATAWVAESRATSSLPIGYFGSEAGAAVALLAAGELADQVRAVVSRGGRPDLVGKTLADVVSPTLLLVGSRDEVLVDLNRTAYEALGCAKKELAIIPGASNLFEEEGALDAVARQAAGWFLRHLPK